MKGAFAFAILVALALPSSALAENEGEPNLFGLYFDLNLDIFSSATAVELAVPVDLYLVLSDPTVSQISGWEAEFDVYGDALVFDVSITSGGVNTAGDRRFSVTYDEPLMCSATTHLATIRLLPLSYDLNCIRLFGSEEPSSATGVGIKTIGGSYIDAPVRVFSGSDSSAQLNGSFPVIGGPWPCEGLVSNESIGWGKIKALYR